MSNFKVKGIANFPHLLQPTQYQGRSDFFYSVEVLIAEGSADHIELKRILEEEKSNGWPKGLPLDKSGNQIVTKFFLKESNKPGYVKMSCRSKAEYPPKVSDLQNKPVTPGELYSGVEIWVLGNTYTHETGVSAGVNIVLVTGKLGELGELTGGMTTADAIASITGSAPVAAPAPIKAPAPAPALSAALTADGHTLQSMIDAGWTLETLAENGHLA